MFVSCIESRTLQVSTKFLQLSIQHTLRSWTLFDGKEGVESQLGSGGEAIDEASEIRTRAEAFSDGTPHGRRVVGPGNGVGLRP